MQKTCVAQRYMSYCYIIIFCKHCEWFISSWVTTYQSCNTEIHYYSFRYLLNIFLRNELEKKHLESRSPKKALNLAQTFSGREILTALTHQQMSKCTHAKVKNTCRSVSRLVMAFGTLHSPVHMQILLDFKLLTTSALCW